MFVKFKQVTKFEGVIYSPDIVYPLEVEAFEALGGEAYEVEEPKDEKVNKKAKKEADSNKMVDETEVINK